MSAVPSSLRRGDRRGGVTGYPLDGVYREVAWLGTRVHWPLNELLGLDHAERRRWLDEIAGIEGADERRGS
jgi:hypothetical protein